MKYKQFYVDKHAEHNDWWVGTFIYETPISTINVAPRLRENLYNYSCKTMLDYGSGKGHQYSIEHMDQYLDVGVDMYDPGIPGIDTLQDKTYDAVVCNNVLQLIPEEEIDSALAEIFAKATKFVMITTTPMPSTTKFFDDGTNININVQLESYWQAKIDQHNVNNLPVDLLYVEW